MQSANVLYPHHQLSFDEANIVISSIRNMTLSEFQARLDTLQRHAEDSTLLASVTSLIDKVSNMTEEEFRRLREDGASGAVLFPANYELPMRTP